MLDTYVLRFGTAFGSKVALANKRLGIGVFNRFIGEPFVKRPTLSKLSLQEQLCLDFHSEISLSRPTEICLSRWLRFYHGHPIGISERLPQVVEEIEKPLEF